MTMRWRKVSLGYSNGNECISGSIGLEPKPGQISLTILRDFITDSGLTPLPKEWHLGYLVKGITRSLL